MSENQKFHMKMLISLREQIDFQIDKQVEKVIDGTFDRKKCVIVLSHILYGHSLVQDVIDE